MSAEVILLPIAATDVTDSSGRYEFVDPVPGSIVQPRANAAADEMVGIDVKDALLALDAASGNTEISSLQRMAADVSGNGIVSGYDAGLILQKSVNPGSQFPVVGRCGWTWVFEPVPLTLTGQTILLPRVTRLPCIQGQILYDSLQGTVEDQNFNGAAFGDVDTSSATARSSGRSSFSERLHLGRPQRTSDRVRIPIYVEGNLFRGIQLELTFDETQFQLVRVRKLRSAASAMSASHAEAGTLRYAMAGSEPMEPGAVLMVEFEAIDRSAPLQFEIQSSQVAD